jgi:hypothetical protein
VRSGSTGSILDWDSIMTHECNDEDLRCIRLNTTKAHQQPITVLDSEGGRVLTGSKDHTLKVGHVHFVINANFVRDLKFSCR